MSSRTNILNKWFKLNGNKPNPQNNEPKKEDEDEDDIDSKKNHHFFRIVEFNEMQWTKFSNLDFENNLVVGSPFAGPIALMRKKVAKEDKKIPIYIFDQCGAHFSTIFFNKSDGPVSEVAWNNEEVLVIINKLGKVFLYEMSGEQLFTFFLFDFDNTPADIQRKLLKTKIFPEGIVCLSLETIGEKEEFKFHMKTDYYSSELVEFAPITTFQDFEEIDKSFNDKSQGAKKSKKKKKKEVLVESVIKPKFYDRVPFLNWDIIPASMNETKKPLLVVSFLPVLDDATASEFQILSEKACIIKRVNLPPFKLMKLSPTKTKIAFYTSRHTLVFSDFNLSQDFIDKSLLDNTKQKSKKNRKMKDIVEFIVQNPTSTVAAFPTDILWCGNEAVCLGWNNEIMSRILTLESELSKPNKTVDQLKSEADEANKPVDDDKKDLAIGLLKIVSCFDGFSKNLQFEGNMGLIEEFDGIRIITKNSLEFLEKVPQSTFEIFSFGSLEPAALLFDSHEEYEKNSAAMEKNSALAKAKSKEHKKISDEPKEKIKGNEPKTKKDGKKSIRADSITNIFSLKTKRKLHEAINACIDAATHEFTMNLQRKLLQAASYGMKFCEYTGSEDSTSSDLADLGNASGNEKEGSFKFELFNAACKKIKILNQLFDQRITLTPIQFDLLCGVEITSQSANKLSNAIKAIDDMKKSNSRSKNSSLFRSSSKKNEFKIESVLRILSEISLKDKDLSVILNRLAFRKKFEVAHEFAESFGLRIDPLVLNWSVMKLMKYHATEQFLKEEEMRLNQPDIVEEKKKNEKDGNKENPENSKKEAQNKENPPNSNETLLQKQNATSAENSIDGRRQQNAKHIEQIKNNLKNCEDETLASVARLAVVLNLDKIASELLSMISTRSAEDKSPWDIVSVMLDLKQYQQALTTALESADDDLVEMVLFELMRNTQMEDRHKLQVLLRRKNVAVFRRLCEFEFFIHADPEKAEVPFLDQIFKKVNQIIDYNIEDLKKEKKGNEESQPPRFIIPDVLKNWTKEKENEETQQQIHMVPEVAIQAVRKYVMYKEILTPEESQEMLHVPLNILKDHNDVDPELSKYILRQIWLEAAQVHLNKLTNSKMFSGNTIHKTIELALCVPKLEAYAHSMKERFEVGETKFHYMRVKAYCMTFQWPALDKYARDYEYNHNLKDQNWKPFVEYTIRFDGTHSQAMKYIPKLTDVLLKVGSYMKIEAVAEAFQTAFSTGDEPSLNFLLSHPMIIEDMSLVQKIKTRMIEIKQ